MERIFSRKRRLLSLLLAAVMLFAMAPVDALAVGAGDTGSFVNGPYLMTPKTDAMAVVWELDKAMKATITYGTTADDQKTVDVPVEEGEKYQGEPMHMYRARLTGLTPGTAYTYKVALENGQTNQKTVDVPVEEGEKYQGEPMHMYRARLTGLTPGTAYTYKVALENGQTMEGRFRTLPENPEEVRFVVVSDSHRFETAKQVSDAIEKFDPDFILHTGDMVEGTGSQKDQFSYWFQNAGSFLHNVPVVYNSGNHDFGAYFDEYVTKIQKEQYHSNETGRNVSFNCGPVHISMLDSNPWSLFELNSAAGGQVDAATKTWSRAQALRKTSSPTGSRMLAASCTMFRSFITAETMILGHILMSMLPKSRKNSTIPTKPDGMFRLTADRCIFRCSTATRGRCLS